MTLVESGELRLADPVDDLLPELADRRVLTSPDAALTDTVPAHRPITVLDLLTFRSGLGLAFPPAPLAAEVDRLRLGQGPPNPDGVPAPDEWLRRLGTLPLQAQPGERWLYHTSADVLGVLLARAAAAPLSDVLRERVFQPLGMTDTGFHVPADRQHRFVSAYRPGSDDPFDRPDGQWSHPPDFPSAGHGLVSTAPDYLRFARMLRRHGDGLLRPDSVTAMTTDHLTPAQRPKSGSLGRSGWGYCLAVDPDTGRYGWDGGYGTCWTTDPGQDLTAVLFTQRAWSSPEPPPIHTAFWAAIDAAGR
jgi:CubicO group peptidase (beta-lactamase class C family)